MGRQFGRRQLGQPVEGQPLRLGPIEQSSQGLRQQDGLLRRCVPLPLEDQPREQQLPLQFRNRGRRLERRFVLGRQVLPGRKGEIVLVDIADRVHARQQHRRPAALPQEGLAQSAAGPAGRQQDQNRRQAFGRIAEAVEQAAREGGDEIPVRRNGVDVCGRSAGSGHGAVSRR